MKKIAIIGAGLIGNTWAAVFAQAGHEVCLYDPSPDARGGAPDRVASALKNLESFDLLVESPETILSRISVADDISSALAGAVYVQECAPERLELKRELFQDLDRLAEPEAILASATSTIPGSQFTEQLPGRERCIIAHPSTPPHVLSLVEVCPTSWTSASVVEETRAFLESLGHVTTLIRKETDGFILNRLQAALVCEAYRLWEDGCASAEDIEKTVRETLGMRWALMGPFETISLNARNGLQDYLNNFGEIFYRINRSQHARPFDPAAVRRLEEEWLAQHGNPTWDERRARRDRRLLDLVAHKKHMDKA